jgi:hypothetical protein
LSGPNWAEQVTAIATAVGALGLLGALGAAVFAGQQVKEARKARESQIAADFFRRWNEGSLVETRRLVATFETREELKAAFEDFIASNADEAYVFYRELDYFEHLAALEHVGGDPMFESLVAKMKVALSLNGGSAQTADSSRSTL